MHGNTSHAPPPPPPPPSQFRVHFTRRRGSPTATGRKCADGSDARVRGVTQRLGKPRSVIPEVIGEPLLIHLAVLAITADYVLQKAHADPPSYSHTRTFCLPTSLPACPLYLFADSQEY